jgi:hypothetical protein
MAVHRVTEPGGRVIVAEGSGRGTRGSWLVYFEDDPEDGAGGFTLAGLVATILGYNVAHDEIPEWIVRWAEQVGG